jgi:hypothetical protein
LTEENSRMLGDKSAPQLLCLPEIPHELLWDQTPSFAVRG